MNRNFENPEESFSQVSADLFARIMGRVSDIAMVLGSEDGVIRDVSYGTSNLINAGLGPLIGKSLIDLVTTESRGKIEELLANGSQDGRWRHLNFPVQGGSDVPISMQTFGLGRGRMLAVGRDERQGAVMQRRFIEAQRELEQNHARLRQADLRFQTMLALSDLAVLTVDGDDLRVLDLNHVAAERLASASRNANGQPFLSLIDREDVDTVRKALDLAMATGRIGSFSARLRGGGEQVFQVALFRYEHASRLLVRLMDDAERREAFDATCSTHALFAHLPHAMVVTNAQLRILHVNRAFIDLAQLSVEENALSQPLERFIGRNGVDTDILVGALRDQNAVRNFATVLTGAFGAATEIDIDAVRLNGRDQECFGFFVRVADRSGRAATIGAQEGAGFAERVTEVVGRVSLKEIVRDTTDVIERLCIETALGMTENNRAAASEMLGISRQSLYAKLARYGIGGDDDENGSA
ncbi:transcriptional regulator PpsR [Novosphingopyxis sp. YJ-S2-01]|uniref:transcriptional regulator PpsR n=1 Tax=Novosphingopyxis sp. YJ-S2-01 TaxID=2794021 RepID=UPI0018DDD4D5|nr:transcriptional regulator PpsR [Novosphingopyxis sp. YJ-S2-01]MBH9536751.1 transcriptional regulator PpsR [Novosphingopyxis sp. YJ-S2-01]